MGPGPAKTPSRISSFQNYREHTNRLLGETYSRPKLPWFPTFGCTSLRGPCFTCKDLPYLITSSEQFLTLLGSFPPQTRCFFLISVLCCPSHHPPLRP